MTGNSHQSRYYWTMRIQFLAHAAFLVTADSGTKFMLDPYESGGFSGRVGYDPITVEPDCIIITHDHLDHSHTETIPGEFEVIRHQGVYNGVRVRSVQVYHDMQQGKRFGGSIDMKIFSVDGITICHCGDIGELLDEPGKLDEIGQVDVLIIPTGGYYTLGPDGAATVVKKINPRLVIPCHYKTAKCGFDIEPVDPFLSYFESVEHANSSAVDLTAEALPEPSKCLVLDMLYA